MGSRGQHLRDLRSELRYERAFLSSRRRASRRPRAQGFRPFHGPRAAGTDPDRAAHRYRVDGARLPRLSGGHGSRRRGEDSPQGALGQRRPSWPAFIARRRSRAASRTRTSCRRSCRDSLPAGAGARRRGRDVHRDGVPRRHLAPLGARGARAARCPSPRALRIVLQICEAVGEAHGAGIVHRDLKPENVMLAQRGDDADFVKVLDFGIARLPGGNTPAVTQAGAIFGTARYVSPEGAIGQPGRSPGRRLRDRDDPLPGARGQDALRGRHRNRGARPSNQRSSAAPALASSARRRCRSRSRRPSCETSPSAPRIDSKDARTLGLLLVDAARASGLAPETLVPRSALFEASASGAASLPANRRSRSRSDPASPERSRPRTRAPPRRYARPPTLGCARRHARAAAPWRSSRLPRRWARRWRPVGAYRFQDAGRPRLPPDRKPSRPTRGSRTPASLRRAAAAETMYAGRVERHPPRPRD